MKKHIIIFLSVTMCLILSAGIFTACGTETDEPQKYTISFYADEALVGTVKTAGNEEIELPDAPHKSGAVFEGWYSDKGTWSDKLTKDTYAERALTENIAVYAYYIPDETPLPSEYTITFYIDGDVADIIETSGNERLVLPSAPKRDDYTFEGWFFDNGIWQDELTADTYADKTLTKDVSVYAYYKKIEEPEPEPPAEYTVTFDVDHGTPIAPMTTSRIDKEPQTVRDGYTFAGWYKDSGLTEKVTFPYEVTKAQTLYAKWEKNTYTVRFDTDGGTTVGDMVVSVIERSPVTTKSGYTFAGWYKDSGLTEKVTFPYEVTKAQTLYARWEKNTYTVRFELNGGTGVSDMTVSEIQTEPVPTRNGYTFAGWYKDSGFSDKVTFPYEVTKTQTLYAKWEKNTYTVRFELNGGTGVSDMTVSEIQTEPVPTRNGYTFAGWYKDSGFSDKVTFPYEVTKTQTLYAKWEKNGPEEIVFTVDGDGVLTGVSGITESGTTVTVPSEIDGIAVREIGDDVFKDNGNIVSLIIPDSVKTLGYRMCSGCTALREVRLPSGITVIPDEAFDGCSSLRTINFPDTLKEIRSDAFCGTALTEFVAPDSLTGIWLYAFKDCVDLATVELTNVRSISSGAFQNCTSLRSVRLSDKMTGLSDHIFDGCTSLAFIDMPDDPIPVSFSVFNGTAYYNDPSNWENGVLYVDGYLIAANADFAPLTEYTVKEGTVVIADNAFSNVGYSSKLKKMTLPDGLYRIGKNAFSKLFSLSEINMPDSVRSVGYGAFDGSGYDKESNYTDGGLYVGNWLVSVDNVAMTSFTVREGTVGVADGKDTALFPSRAQKITQLSLPSSLEYIGPRSFARLRITDLQLPAGLQTMGEGAFENCSSLKTANLGDCYRLKSIGGKAFSGAALSEITIPESVVSMGELVFNHNTVDLTIRCEASEQPEGWDKNWSYSYREGVEITVEWGNT